MELAPFFISPNDLTFTSTELGRGGYGIVQLASYTGTDAGMQREVAVKVFKEHEPGLQKECQTLIVLANSTAYVCKALGWTLLDQNFGLLMCRYKKSLADKIKAGPLSIVDILRYAREMACGLAEIHSRRYVHRDVKPQNALLDEQGQLVLTDFGLVRQMSSADVEFTSHAPGTWPYMAPELWAPHCNDRVEVSAAIDIWALGITMIQMLERSFFAPFTAKMPPPKDLVNKMQSKQVVVPNCLSTNEAKDLLNQEPGLVSIINSCLEVNAADRPTAQELIQRLLSLEVRHGQPAYRDPYLAGPAKDQHLLQEMLNNYKTLVSTRDVLVKTVADLTKKAADLEIQLQTALQDKAELEGRQGEPEQQLAAMAQQLENAHNLVSILMTHIQEQHLQSSAVLMKAKNELSKELLSNQGMESSIKDWCIAVGHDVPTSAAIAMNDCIPSGSQEQQAGDTSNTNNTNNNSSDRDSDNNNPSGAPVLPAPGAAISITVTPPTSPCIMMRLPTALELVWRNKLEGKTFEELKHLEAEDVIAVAGVLATHKTLGYVNMDKHNIGDEGAEALASALQVNSRLHNLSLQSNTIGSKGAKALANALRINLTSNILELRLGGNNIGVAGAKALATALQTHTRLQTLLIGGNNIGDEGAEALANALQKSTVMQHLDLNVNNIGVGGAKALATALQLNSNTSMRYLDLYGNIIGTEGLKPLASLLKTNTTLRRLDLRKNNICEEAVKPLASALQLNITIENLYLRDDNHISAESFKALGAMRKEGQPRLVWG